MRHFNLPTTLRRHMVSVVMVLYSSQVWSGPPLAIDDPGIPGLGQWEVIVAIDGRQFDNGDALDLPLLDVSLALTENSQLSATLPHTVVRSDATSRKTGLGFASIGYKWRWYDDGIREWAVAPSYTFLISHQVFEEGSSDDVNVFSLPVLYAHSFNDWTLMGQLAWILDENGNNAWDYGIALARPLNSRAEWMVELFGAANSSFGNETLNYHLGIDYAIREHFHILASVGSRVRTSSRLADRLNFRYYLGLQFFL